MSKLGLLLILVSLSIGPRLFAEEGGGEGEAPAAEGGAPKSSEEKATKELMDLEKQITTTTAKITAKEGSVRELIQQKQAEQDPEKLAQILKMLQQEHRELNALIKEQTTELGVLQYRYPERGITLQRKYKRFNAKSLEEMEKSMGLEGHLKRAREKVERVYGVDESKNKKAVKSKTESQTDKESILAPATISK